MIIPAGVCFLDIESGAREAKTVEQLAYDWSWHGDAKTNTEMKVLVQKSDAVYATTLVSGLTDVGEQPWSPTDKGQYMVTLRTYVDGYYLDTLDETALFNVAEHIPLEVTYFTATPRYPWNGKVDVDLTFTGDNRDYAVTLTAKDNNGSTNLPVRTVVGRAVPSAPQSSINEFAFEVDSGGVGHAALPPGTYRLTWDADADITADADFSRVSMSVKVEEK